MASTVIPSEEAQQIMTKTSARGILFLWSCFVSLL
jgi:hypothetical protein